MRFYFTRHGESEANRLRIISNRDLPYALTETGRQQALALAGRLRDKSITRVFASPILRARQTGEILATELSIPLELADGLREPDCGVLEGRGDAEAWAEHRRWFVAWLSGEDANRGPSGGETLEAVWFRFGRFVQSLVEQYGDSDEGIVLVSHGEMLTLGLPVLVPTLDSGTIMNNYLGHTALICVDVQPGHLTFDESQSFRVGILGE